MSDTGTVIGTINKNASELVNVTLDAFNGFNVFDVRVFAKVELGSEPRATKKGVCLRIEQLPRLLEILTDAAVEARRRGLLPKGSG